MPRVDGIPQGGTEQAHSEVQLVQEWQSRSHTHDGRLADGPWGTTPGEWQGDEGFSITGGGSGLKAPGIRTRGIELPGDS